MRNLVRRYVTVQQRRAECGGVTEDDVNEIKQDVSAFRCELVEILRNSGMNTSTANAGAPGVCTNMLLFAYLLNIFIHVSRRVSESMCFYDTLLTTLRHIS